MSVRAYPLKIPANERIWNGISILSRLTKEAAQDLIDQHWTYEWIHKLESSSLKAYKILGEEKVQLVKEGRILYVPSRIRRSIAEWAGRTLRSQSSRIKCFEHIKVVLQDIDSNQKLDNLVPQIFYSIRLRFGVYYKYQLIRQLLRMIKRWTIKYRVDITLLEYTSLVHPKLNNFTFPYAVDDNQAIKIIRKGNVLEVEMKLPKSNRSYSIKDWEWMAFPIEIPKKIVKKLACAKDQEPKRPDLRYKVLKSGMIHPMLQFAWEFENKKLNYSFYHKKRVLAIDLGLVNLSTSVICEAGLQITPPIFYKRSGTVIEKIERMYEVQSRIQKKISKLKEHAPGQTRRRNELARIHAKLKRKRTQEISLLVKHFLALVEEYGCSTIVLEDLRSIKTPKGNRKWSRRLSNWFHGKIHDTVSDKANVIGIKVKTVNPRGTSSYCPRCGKKGNKIKDPESKKVNNLGRYFYCANCCFLGDRDYIGSLNIYRLYRSYTQKKYSLSSSRTVLYKSIGHPLNRSSGKILC